MTKYSNIKIQSPKCNRNSKKHGWGEPCPVALKHGNYIRNRTARKKHTDRHERETAAERPQPLSREVFRGALLGAQRERCDKRKPNACRKTPPLWALSQSSPPASPPPGTQRFPPRPTIPAAGWRKGRARSSQRPRSGGSCNARSPPPASGFRSSWKHPPCDSAAGTAAASPPRPGPAVCAAAPLAAPAWRPPAPPPFRRRPPPGAPCGPRHRLAPGRADGPGTPAVSSSTGRGLRGGGPAGGARWPLRGVHSLSTLGRSPPLSAACGELGGPVVSGQGKLRWALGTVCVSFGR